ncbi:MAG: type I glutamate--ammonia ligase [Sulfolobales archaeon]
MNESEERKRLLIHYTDLAGFLRSVETQYNNSRKFSATFDGSSVKGFADINKSDMLLDYDPRTLRIVPWDKSMYRAIGRVYNYDERRSDRDPRYIAEKTDSYLKDHGYNALVGAEIEFFIFNSVRILGDRSHYESGFSVDPGDRFRPEKGYHTLDSGDRISSFRLLLAKYLEELGYSVETSHHEVATSQIETSLGSGDPVTAGDSVITIKWVARHIARESGMIAVFMPKPIYGENGSGMHLHISLWDSDRRRNLFASEDNGLSDVGRYFIGGLIEHCRSLSAIVAPTSNSYKRLVPGYEAPVYCVWGFYNRSAGIRIPYAGDPRRIRLEFRVPDPSSNPYLAISAVLMAGLDGIKKKIDPGEPYEDNIYRLSEKEIREKRLKVLPRDLIQALEELESDQEYLKPVFSRDLIEKYIEIKKQEAREVLMRPHPYEYILYLDL